MSACYIYALRDPELPEETRYVGKTIDLQYRYKKHLELAQGGPKATRVQIWIAGLLARERKPMLVILDEVSESEWQEAERWWIAFYKSDKLLNGTIGGEGIRAGSSVEVGRKIAAALRGRKISPEVRARIGEGGKRSWVGREDRREISRITGFANRGRVRSPETRAKMSAAKKGKVSWNKGISSKSPMEGKRHTPEALAKISENARNRAVLVCDQCGKEIRGGNGNLIQHKKGSKCATLSSRGC